jgi:hypothetical protein
LAQKNYSFVFNRIDALNFVCDTGAMSHHTKKLIAILMMLWLPLFSGAALASSITMQMPQSVCHEMADDGDMMASDMVMDDSAMLNTSDHDAANCHACGVCHLACTGYLAVPSLQLTPVQNAAQLFTAYLVSFAPLLPPPLASA